MDGDHLGAADLMAKTLPSVLNDEVAKVQGKRWLLAGRVPLSSGPAAYRQEVVDIVAQFDGETGRLLGVLKQEDQTMLLVQLSGLRVDSQGGERRQPSVSFSALSPEDLNAVLEHVCGFYLCPASPTGVQTSEEQELSQRVLEQLGPLGRAALRQHIMANLFGSRTPYIKLVLRLVLVPSIAPLLGLFSPETDAMAANFNVKREIFHQAILETPDTSLHKLAIQLAEANQSLIDVTRLLTNLDDISEATPVSRAAVMSSVLGITANPSSTHPTPAAAYARTMIGGGAQTMMPSSASRQRESFSGFGDQPGPGSSPEDPDATQSSTAGSSPAAHEVALRLLPWLDSAAAAAVWRAAGTKSEPAAAGIALMPPDAAHDAEAFASQLGAALFPLSGDPCRHLWQKDGSPQPTALFAGDLDIEPVPERVLLAAAAVRHMLDARIESELESWRADPGNAGKFITALNYTKCCDDHIQRYLDTPVGLLQTSDQLGASKIPQWYDAAVVQPAVEALCHQLERCKAEASGNDELIQQCQSEAGKSLKEDQKLYTIAKNKAEAVDRTATDQLNLLAAEQERRVKQRWPQRPTQPNLPPDATIAQVKLQAVQFGVAFRTAVGGIEKATKLKISMVRGSLDPTTNLLTKYRGSEQDEPPDLLFLDKAGYRMAQKVWVRGNANTICDVNRALAVARSVQDFLEGVHTVFENDHIEIVDVKDRLNTPTSGGWSDLVLLFRVKSAGADAPIGELQIALDGMMVARQGMNAHEAYAIARYFVEMLLKCGREYNAETDEQKLQKINELAKTTIATLKREVEQLKKTNQLLLGGPSLKAGWLHFKTGKSSWKPRWVVLKEGWFTYHKKDDAWLKAEAPLLTDLIKKAKGWMHRCTVESQDATSVVITSEAGESLTLRIPTTGEDASMLVPVEMLMRVDTAGWADAIRAHSGVDRPVAVLDGHAIDTAAQSLATFTVGGIEGDANC